VTEENIFIIGALTTPGGNKGLDFLKGDRPIHCRKITPKEELPRQTKASPGPVSKPVDPRPVDRTPENWATSQYKVTVDGNCYEVLVEDETGKVSGISPSSGGQMEAPAAAQVIEVKAQLPGNVYEILFVQGDQVKEGETLVILEAMKMETPVIAPANGTIDSIAVTKGQTVQSGQVLLTLI
jgi:pyruvate carboxylase subunit B